MILERQKDTVYPAYLAFATEGGKPVCWIEKPSGRNNGWAVHLCSKTPGEEGSATMWFYRFTQAKAYAGELCAGQT